MRYPRPRNVVERLAMIEQAVTFLGLVVTALLIYTFSR